MKLLKDEMIDTLSKAKLYGRKTYLYLLQTGDYEITTTYMDRSWLFCAYPGGKGVMSIKGKSLLDTEKENRLN